MFPVSHSYSSLIRGQLTGLQHSLKFRFSPNITVYCKAKVMVGGCCYSQTEPGSLFSVFSLCDANRLLWYQSSYLTLDKEAKILNYCFDLWYICRKTKLSFDDKKFDLPKETDDIIGATEWFFFFHFLWKVRVLDQMNFEHLVVQQLHLSMSLSETFLCTCGFLKRAIDPKIHRHYYDCSPELDLGWWVREHHSLFNAIFE